MPAPFRQSTARACAALLALGGGIAATAGAQAARPLPGTDSSSALPTPATLADTGGRGILRGIAIRRNDIFDPAEATTWVRRLTNSLHMRTREHVIRRELLLRPGMPVDSARAAETARNLRRLGVFREVIIDTLPGDTVIRFTTRDGWSTRTNAAIRSAGSQRLLNLSMVETNFLGLASILEVRYQEDPDRSLVRFGMLAPRIIDDRISVGAFVNRLSDGQSFGGVVELPFFSLSSRTAARLAGASVAGRVLRFRDGNLRPVDSLERRFELGTATVSRAVRASPYGYTRLGAELQYRREDYGPQVGIAPTTRTQTGALTAWMEWSRARFEVARNFRLMGPQEDVDLSSTLRIGTTLAPRFLGYRAPGVGPIITGQTGMRWQHGFVQLFGRADGLLTRAGLDTASALFGTTAVWQPHRRHTVTANVTLGWEKGVFPGEEFDLGLVRGPRGFPLHAFTGDRMRFAMIEHRWVAVPEAFKLFALGLGVFAERGGAWFDGSRPRYGTAIGGGLRAGSTRSSQGFGALRLDLVWRSAGPDAPAGWVPVVGIGYPFDLLR